MIARARSLSRRRPKRRRFRCSTKPSLPRPHRLPFDCLPVPASSRVNPLPQVLHRSQTLCSTCGSGFTREEAGTGCKHSLLQTPRDNFLNTCYVYHS
ncbi:hypothetical protein E8E78_05135 [Pseudomonas sp. BN505]|nr:hypothetical protein [Pseudomonas sp. BN605]MDH4855989.1 hypothetical protein [Pseudomonas sp. BN505]